MRIALANDKNARLRFAALQTDVGRSLLQRCGRMPDDISSIVLATPDGCYTKSDAVLRIAGLLRQPFPALAALVWPIPSVVRDALYDQVPCMPLISKNQCKWMSLLAPPTFVNNVGRMNCGFAAAHVAGRQQPLQHLWEGQCVPADQRHSGLP